jgi:g-D-glutamyl-meso-diaminopimelate peptidase
MKHALFLLVAFSVLRITAFGQVLPVADTLQKPDSTLVTEILIQDILVRDSLDLKYYVVEDTSMYTFEMIQNDISYFEATWPEFIKAKTIGNSEFGLPLRGFTLAKTDQPKPMVFIVGNIHAREDFSSKMTMKVANVMLLSLAGKSDLYPGLTSMLDVVDIFFLPVANPDGLKIAQNDLGVIESQARMWFDSIYIDETILEWKANGKGIDLNSSFDDNHWAVKKGGNFHAKRASEGYKGSFAAEPIETQALQNFIQTNRPICTISFHTKGNILYWADAITHPMFEDIDTKMSADARKASGFELGKIGTKPSDFGCGLENYVRSKSGSIGVCVELSCGGGGRKQHPDSRFNELVWQKAWEIPFIYIVNTVEYKQDLLRIQDQFYGKLEDKP